MKASLIFLFMIGMLAQARASQPMVENLALLNYLKSVEATSPAPEIASRITRNWDKSILASDVFFGYNQTKAATEPSHSYDCIVSEYIFNGIKVITKQTSCVWFAEIEPPGKDTNPLKIASALLMLKSKSETGILNQVDQGITESQKLTGTNSTVYGYVNKSGGTDYPSWRNGLRIVSDGKHIYIWTLKFTGKPMAGVVGYDDTLNKNWFAHLERPPFESDRKKGPEPKP